jgi:hypothetical protein
VGKTNYVFIRKAYRILVWKYHGKRTLERESKWEESKKKILDCDL